MTLSSANPACSGEVFTLSLQNSITGTGVGYQWQSSTDGMDPWSDIGISAPELETFQTTPAFYRCKVSCAGNIGISTPVLVDMNGSTEYVFLEGTDAGTTCYGATNMIFVAEDEATYLIVSGGDVEMVAGIAIAYLPGTAVQTGGRLQGYIDPCGPYCSLDSRQAGVKVQIPVSEAYRQVGFTLKPNPTAGDVLLEMKEGERPDVVQIVISGITGKQVMPVIITKEHRCRISMSGIPPGLYFVRVVTARAAETSRIIKL
jgi:hypothetical protein